MKDDTAPKKGIKRRGMLGEKFLSFADDSMSLSKIMVFAVCFRMFIWLAMSVSCHMLPDHNPGDDVLRFPLPELPPIEKEVGISASSGRVLAYQDCRFSLLESTTKTATVQDTVSCSAQPRAVSSTVWLLQHSVYPFLLTPLTRWDAARFLRLAHRPQLRKPTRDGFVAETNECSKVQGDNDTTNTENSDPSFSTSTASTCLQDPFVESEQAHAFLPLFPFLIRVTAAALLMVVPRTWLPGSCESLLVLSAVLLNTLCFLVAIYDLYNMTERLLKFHRQQRQREATKKAQDDPMLLLDGSCESLARRVSLVFVINPANVFFGTVYSEALAAALLFRGCSVAMTMVLQNAARSDDSSGASKSRWWLTMMHSVIVWWLAALTRSNGSLYGGFLLLYSFGLAFRSDSSWFNRIAAVLWTILLVGGLAAGSVGWHNYMGYQYHCSSGGGLTLGLDTSAGAADDGSMAIQPSWCDNPVGPWFNLYGYVQRKHWNVGFLHYYQWKQIPNFLLAAPILVLSSVAVLKWIVSSWNRHNKDRYRNNRNERTSFVYLLTHWAVTALQEFAGAGQDASASRDNMMSLEEALLSSPLLLGYYAVLAASTLLGLTVAHVQISTRLICSSCPALYWFLAVVISRNRRRMGDAVLLYCALYIILGVVLHPNWLPWT
jgi:phosphatidylinositol glycan class V